jgi:beta-lactamase superfamily II metal-dependent hydrolase
MSYHGYEIYFQTLGNADSIFVRHHNQGVKTNILIDGGRKSHVEAVRGFLRDRGESEIHHLVCSHHHDDHAGGLVELVQDKTLTIRQAWVHTEEIMADVANLTVYAAHGYNKLVETLRASKQMQTDLISALHKRGIPIFSPWAGLWIGPLYVLSPSKQFYQEQLAKIKEESLAKALNDRYLRRQLNGMFDVVLGKQALFGAKAEAEEEEAGELGGEPTSPENEVSTVICLPWDNADNTRRYSLLTADAGTEALKFVRQVSETANGFLKAIPWMQLPHHGSRRNLSEELIDYYKPKMSFVSAEGSVKHPSKKLVNAVKARQGAVYSTHYPDNVEGKGNWLRHQHGNVPDVAITPATPLWDAKV